MELMGSFLQNLIDSLNSDRQSMNYLCTKKESEVFKNSMSGFYQTYCYVQRFLNRYLVEENLNIERFFDKIDSTKVQEKFLNSKVYLKSIEDYKIEAIHSVVFAQKVC